jgi:hypothetical protein
MTCVSAEVEIEHGVVRPPWETAPLGVVSLFTMLEFAARDYVEISYHFGLFLGSVRAKQCDPEEVSKGLSKILSESNRLGLWVTRDRIGEMFMEVLKTSPESVQRVSAEEIKIQFASLPDNRFYHYVESVYATMKSELSTIAFRAIPKERVQYMSEEWLKDTLLPDLFPTSTRELRRAASCYALGEATASVFHSMRALEPALNTLAEVLGVTFAYENWQKVIEQIESKVRDLGQQPKSPSKVNEEKFYGAAASHLYFVKNAWRNHVSHTRDTYSDLEASAVMDRTRQFIESLCPNLAEPSRAGQ